MVKHYTLEEEWAEFKEDETFVELYEEEFWMTFTAEITPDEVTIYIDDLEVITLSNSEGCVGENGYIGIRAGSSGGWKIKNLQVTEGVGGAETSEPTEEPTETPTEAPTEEPTQEPIAETTETATAENTAAPVPTQKPVAQKDGGFPWWIAGLVAVVVVAAGVVIWLILKKKNK